jgi:hypothetical protein
MERTARQTVEELLYDEAGQGYWRIAGTLHGAAGSALVVPYRMTFYVDGEGSRRMGGWLLLPPAAAAAAIVDRSLAHWPNPYPPLTHNTTQQTRTQRASCASS